ncbi:MAG: hypothetical protein JXA82_01205 [Sedimentisphaerales bacterium]|nr:hypothetical protein [Sedimentisphaerales bacterium]
MQILEIKLAGLVKSGQQLPELFVTISRIPGQSRIRIVFQTCEGQTEEWIPAGNLEQIQAMAKRLQRMLDGYDGTRSMIMEYNILLEYFAD